MQARGYGSGGASERGSGLLVAHFFQIAEGYGFAIVGRQGENRLAHEFDGFGARGIFGWRGGIESVAGAAPFPFAAASLIIFGAGREGYVRALAFKTLQNLVARDAEEKCAEGSFCGVELGGLSDERHENFLRCVLGQCAAAAHVQSEAEERALPAAEDGGESFLVARAEPAHQAVIADF